LLTFTDQQQIIIFMYSYALVQFSELFLRKSFKTASTKLIHSFFDLFTLLE